MAQHFSTTVRKGKTVHLFQRTRRMASRRDPRATGVSRPVRIRDGLAACGAPPSENQETTKDRELVTCERCKATRAWKEGATPC